VRRPLGIGLAVVLLVGVVVDPADHTRYLEDRE
jgi:hypothetical protein